MVTMTTIQPQSAFAISCKNVVENHLISNGFWVHSLNFKIKNFVK